MRIGGVPADHAAARRARFVIDSRRVGAAIVVAGLTVELVLVALDFVVNWHRLSGSPPIRRLFNITREDGLASWFAVTQTFLVALVLWAIVAVCGRLEVARLRRIGWLFTACLFSFLAVDDGAMIHERIGSTVKLSLEGAPAPWLPGPWPTYEWHLVYMPLLALAGVLLVAFLWREIADAGRPPVAAAIVCLAAAIGLDFAEGIEGTYTTLENLSGIRAATLEHFSKSLEEFLEMFAMTLLLAVFTRHLLGLFDVLEINTATTSDTRQGGPDPFRVI